MLLTNEGQIWPLRTNCALAYVSVMAVDRPRALTVLRMFFFPPLFHCQEISQSEDKFFRKNRICKGPLTCIKLGGANRGMEGKLVRPIPISMTFGLKC
jgi:hypothetical protein